MLIIWHNPRCSKSRQTLSLIEAAGAEVLIRLYLQNSPSAEELKVMIGLLGLTDPRDLMRKGEAIYKIENLKNETDPEVLIQMMAENPILIERPVVTDQAIAVIGRPPEAVNALL